MDTLTTQNLKIIKKLGKEYPIIDKALKILTRKQHSQVAKDGVIMPLAVAVSLGNEDPDAVVVALLHGALKNKVAQEQELCEVFSSQIIAALRVLIQRDNEPYMEFIKRCADNTLARIVKIAYLAHYLYPKRVEKIIKHDKYLTDKYTTALNYLLDFVDQNEITRILDAEARYLPKGTIPHDALNKAAFARKEIIQSFLRSHVNESFVHKLDLTHIEALPTEFITHEMRKRYSDSVKKIRWQGRDAYLLMITEFQSTKDKWSPVRSLAYTALLWLDLIHSGVITNNDTLPPVFSIVIYSGKADWQYSMSLHDLLPPMDDGLRKYQPNHYVLLVEEILPTEKISG